MRDPAGNGLVVTPRTCGCDEGAYNIWGYKEEPESMQIADEVIQLGESGVSQKTRLCRKCRNLNMTKWMKNAYYMEYNLVVSF